MSIADKLESALPAKPVPNGATLVPDDLLRDAVKALREAKPG